MIEEEEKTKLTREELLDIVEAQKAAIADLKAANAAENGGEAVEDNDDNDNWLEDIEKMEQRLINKFKGR